MAIPIVVLLVMCLHQFSGNPRAESGLCKEAMLHCFLFSCGLAWAVLGTYWNWQAEDCSRDLKEYVELAVIISWTGLPIMCCMYCVLLCLSTAVLATSEAAESESFESCQVQRPALRRGLVRQVLLKAFASQRSRAGMKFCTVCRRQLLKTEAAAVDAGGESLCSGCSKDEERHTLMSRQMEDQQRLQAEFESSLLVRQEKFGEDVQQLGENLHTLHSLEAASLDQLRGGLAEVHAALNREMASLSRVEDQLGELRDEVMQPSPAAAQQHQQDHQATMLASRQVSELLHQERARAAATRLRNLVAPSFKDIGSLQVAFVLWKMRSRYRVAFEHSLAYREKMVDRADLQAIVTAWRSASRPSRERLLDSELQELAKLPAPEPVREVDPLARFVPPGRLLEDSPYSVRPGGSQGSRDRKPPSDSEDSQDETTPGGVSCSPEAVHAVQVELGAKGPGTREVSRPGHAKQELPEQRAPKETKAVRDADFTDTSSEEDEGIGAALPIEEIPEEIEIEDDAFGYGSRSLNPRDFRRDVRADLTSSLNSSTDMDKE